MVKQRLVGSRLRQKRLDLGLRQSAIAETVGISASYLNLIEHNKRRIGGKLLGNLARALELDPQHLADGADDSLLTDLRVAVADADMTVELDRIDDLAGDYPGWAGLIAAQAAQITALRGQLALLSNRASGDPALAASLHDVISAVSAIRSSASILVGPEKLDPDWQRRFYKNIHSDSLRLAESSEAMIARLNAPVPSVDPMSSPQAQADRYLAATAYHMPALEQGGTPKALLRKSDLKGDARALLDKVLCDYADDVAALPLAAFEKACRTHDYNPVAVAGALSVPLWRVLRRLAQLPPEAGHPNMGLVICDAAGAVLFAKPLAGFAFPVTGGGCPLWPLYAAFAQPDRPLRLQVALPEFGAPEYDCIALAHPTTQAGYDAPPTLQSVMLIRANPPSIGDAAVPVGLSCQICPRMGCASRRAPATAVADP